MQRVMKRRADEVVALQEQAKPSSHVDQLVSQIANLTAIASAKAGMNKCRLLCIANISFPLWMHSVVLLSLLPSSRGDDPLCRDEQHFCNEDGNGPPLPHAAQDAGRGTPGQGGIPPEQLRVITNLDPYMIPLRGPTIPIGSAGWGKAGGVPASCDDQHGDGSDGRRSGGR